ncbi:hypothetical protein FS842_000699 [Serendipita sp. 407]|nr:hypothetical protein FS842_000699 [Serendipita sp. 407]
MASSTANLSSASLPRQHQRSKGFKFDRFNKLLFYLFPTSHDEIRSHGRRKGTSRPQGRQGPTAILIGPSAASAQSPPSITTLTRPQTAPAANTSASSANDMLHSAHQHHHHAAGPEPPLDIVLLEDVVVLRGTGTDFESGTIRGIVRLTLQEDTDIKAVLVRCTGKSRVMVANGAHSQPHTLIHYLKETELLEGDKSHPHTLKAGRHEFPFTYELDARSPASLFANFGLAAIEYRLRATAIRPSSFATNFTVTKDLAVIRSFSNEALEFQQTLEIENVWPEKLQYAVVSSNPEPRLFTPFSSPYPSLSHRFALPCLALPCA